MLLQFWNASIRIDNPRSLEDRDFGKQILIYFEREYQEEIRRNPLEGGLLSGFYIGKIT